MAKQSNPKKNPDSPVGESVTRLDARDKVTGAAQFADDIQRVPEALLETVDRVGPGALQPELEALLDLEVLGTSLELHPR